MASHRGVSLAATVACCACLVASSWASAELLAFSSELGFVLGGTSRRLAVDGAGAGAVSGDRRSPVSGAKFFKNPRSCPQRETGQGLAQAACLASGLAALGGARMLLRSSERRRQRRSLCAYNPKKAPSSSAPVPQPEQLPPSQPAPVTQPRYPGTSDKQKSLDFASRQLPEYLQTGALWPWTPDAEALVADALKVLTRERALERVQVPDGGHINVVGDVHGQFFDVLEIFNQNGLPSSENPYLFNGDFVDRGSFSVEVLLLLLAWKVALPEHVHLARGNHESHDMNVPYGFTGEVLTKYGPEAYETFQNLFDNLPLAHVINSDVLVVHGGLPREAGVRLDEIESMDRVAASRKLESSRESNLFTDLMWADPRSQQGHRRSERGGNVVTFGPDVTKRFLDDNGLSLLIRSHEVKDAGFEWQHDNRCLTVFSAPLYCDSCDNDGAVIRLHAEAGCKPLRPEVRQFGAAFKPDVYVPAMVYSPMDPASRKWLSKDARSQLRQLMGS